MAIKFENAPILVLNNIINQLQDELYIKLIIKESLDSCDLEKLNTISELEKRIKIELLK